MIPPFIASLEAERDGQGRLIVDPYMRLGDGCFVAGDAASFKHVARPLRMAVQFSIAQADAAAGNILRSVSGRKLKKYRPFDLGFLVPLANKKACGKILFFRVFGISGWFLHYCVCIYRSASLRNRVGIFCDIFLKAWR